MSKRRESKRQMLAELSSAFAVERSESDAHKRGAFGIEAEASSIAKRVELELIQEKLREYDRGYEGNTRRCPKCGNLTQRYKGDVSRQIELESGELELIRAYYVCDECKESSHPLDEKLGLVKGKEQGRLRKKLSMLAVVTPYHQAPEVCETMLGADRHAASLRRLLLRESQRYIGSKASAVNLPICGDETVYLQIDGHMCPTREERKDLSDQGYREAKAVLAYHEKDLVQVSKKRKEILNRVLKAEIASAEDFLSTVRNVYRQVQGDKAETVVFIADGAKWIWNIAEEIAPHAIQILDFAHAKQYLYQFAQIRFAHEPFRVKPWVQEQEDRLFKDGVAQVIADMKCFSNIDKAMDSVVAYFENNSTRMKYGTYKKQGLNIGSGAIESAGKQLSFARVKGAGMRWNVVDLNPLLAMRAAFLDNSWKHYWENQELLAA
jgi:hypothetical protein